MGNQSVVDGGRELTCEMFLASDGEILRHCVPQNDKCGCRARGHTDCGEPAIARPLQPRDTAIATQMAAVRPGYAQVQGPVA